MVERRIAEYRLNSAVVALDSVIWTDGEVPGPDHSRVADMFDAWRRAEQDLYRELSDCAASELLARVKAIGDEPQVTAQQPEEIDHYATHRHNSVLALLDGGNTDRIRDRIEGAEARLAKRLPLTWGE